MAFKSINPYNQEVLAEYPALSDKEIDQKLTLAKEAYRIWRKTPNSYRRTRFEALANLLIEKKEELAKLITLEMGKTLGEAVGEIEKCAWLCEFYAAHAETYLRPEQVETDAQKSFVRFDPIGAVLGVMPWNYPFWQVLRYAVPTILAGNVALLKHAPNVPQVARRIEELFDEAGFMEGVFQTLLIFVSDVPDVIKSPIVQAVTLTGSERAGSAVASIAGKQVKKTVLELGGSDPFIVLGDADLEATLDTAIKARFQNAGQSCIAGKRFILVEDIYDQFAEAFQARIDGLIQGDPREAKTQIGPMARLDLANGLKRQLEQSLKEGAKLLTGGTTEGANFQPTLISDVSPGMTAFAEETFGPLAVLVRAANEEEAIFLANQSDLGLGASLWTKDLEKAQHLAADIESGAVFVNGLVRSDPRLPFGGIKKSGYGRELSSYGLREFVNIKTVVIE